MNLLLNHDALRFTKPPQHLATLISPAIRKRFKEQSWESPLITQLVLDHYAGEVYGKNWVQPSAIDLAMYAAHREPGRGT